MTYSKTAIVSGASSGIGRTVCQSLLQEGYQVIGLARDFSKFSCDDDAFRPINIDLQNLDDMPDKLSGLVREMPSPSALICCAGRGEFGSLEQFSYQQIRALMDLNFTSQAYLARAFLPGMKLKASGNIVFLGSEAALSAGRKGALYSASKFALRGLAQALREECAKSGIRITIINPGMVKTEFFDKLDFAPGDDETNYLLPQDVADAVTLVLNARPGTVIDEINLSPLKKVIQFNKPSSS